ncbi:hypothetical protein [Streptomyces sp. HUAS ZL42]|uniref:hypothetical protein n=1 Tax=Streptomyces sp. HUAS ZL42 TaxID=3231715 RepID=UPI00345ED5EA
MLALRLTRGALPAVQLRRLLVAAASAGTGFLLLSALGYAMSHPDTPAASVLRLAWCVAPLAATVHFAVAVARTDPGTRPRPGLATVGLSPARLMAVSATTTALSCTLGSALALLFFLHLRGDLTGMPFDGAAAEFLAAGDPLPIPATLTLLALAPATASLAAALTLRPRIARPTTTRDAATATGRFGAYGMTAPRETFGAYGRFGARLRVTHTGDGEGTRPPAGIRAAGAMGVPPVERSRDRGRMGADGTPPAPGSATHPPTPTDGAPQIPDHRTALPWGITTLTAGLAVAAYASHTTSPTDLTMPAGLAPGPVGVLAGWLLTALGLALAGPGLTHLCGHLLQAIHPGALRLLAGRVLMEEATRIGRPLGVVCAVASGTYTMATLYDANAPAFGPLTTLGALVVTGCTLGTLLTSAVEARQARADVTSALLRLGAPAAMLRSAAALRAAALLALFAPLTLAVAELTTLPLAR